jgi:hypothetical protein
VIASPVTTRGCYGATPGDAEPAAGAERPAALELLLTGGPMTRAQLGERTGLSKVTAVQLLARLGSAGWCRSPAPVAPVEWDLAAPAS